MTAAIANNICAIYENITGATASGGRTGDDVKLIAVSKTVGLKEVKTAIDCGVVDFGENRTSQLCEKQAAFPGVNWHFIGRIQTNKIKKIVGRAALVHSVASLRVAFAINKQALAINVVQPVLIEVNVSGESSKDGVSPYELQELLDGARDLKNLRIKGLMTMALQADEAQVRACFAGLRLLRDKLAPRYVGSQAIDLRELSMGMSGDYTIALEEGATMIRIGTSVWQDNTNVCAAIPASND